MEICQPSSVQNVYSSHAYHSIKSGYRVSMDDPAVIGQSLVCARFFRSMGLIHGYSKKLYRRRRDLLFKVDEPPETSPPVEGSEFLYGSSDYSKRRGNQRRFPWRLGGFSPVMYTYVYCQVQPGDDRCTACSGQPMCYALYRANGFAGVAQW